MLLDLYGYVNSRYFPITHVGYFDKDTLRRVYFDNIFMMYLISVFVLHTLCINRLFILWINRIY